MGEIVDSFRCAGDIKLLAFGGLMIIVAPAH